MVNAPPELHLSIIWEKARHCETGILQRLAADFRVRAVFEVHWTPERFSQNLSRFYGQSLPDDSEKARHCGSGAFLLVLFSDDAPAYAFRNTLAGRQRVNSRVFDFKQHFRSSELGGLPLHATNDVTETRHDLKLLLHRDLEDIERALPPSADGGVTQFHHDLLGADGWPDLATLLSALDQCGRYVVMRNFEGLPDSANLPGHDDIDILCDDLSLARVVNGTQVFDTPHCVHFAVHVGGRELRFDFRHLGDDYYCHAFQRRMLERREYDPKGFHRPSDEDHYYALLYHALLHKPAFGSDYQIRLNAAAQRLGLPALTGHRLQALDVLDAWWAQHGFSYTPPKDPTVLLEFALLDAYRDALGLRQLGDEKRLAVLLDSTTTPRQYAFVPEHLAAHLSQLRPNVLRPFREQLHGRVLEVGAGSGALTAFIAETAREVVAVEPGARIRALAVQRCAELPHVTLRTTLPHEPASFDAIVVVGQLPFAARHLDAPATNPAQALLEQLARLLKPEGTLILAENNLLGLNQMAGAESSARSHLATASKDSTHMGRLTLERTLRAAGFPGSTWLYPFPNLLEAETLLGEMLCDDPDFDAAGLIESAVTQQHGLRDALPFPLEQGWRAIWRNGLLRELSNAFVVVARRNTGTPLHAPAAIHYANRRLPAHAKYVEFVKTPQGFEVQHRRLHPTEPVQPGCSLHMREFDEPYIQGAPWQHALAEQLGQPNWRFLVIENWVATWFDALKKDRRFPATEQALHARLPVPGSMFDAIGRNLIIDEHGHAHFIDQEWVLDKDIPLGYVLFRGIFLSLMSVKRVAPPAPGGSIRTLDIFLYLTRQLGVPVSRAEVTEFVQLEIDLQRDVSGWEWSALHQLEAYELQLVRAAVDETDTLADTSEPVEEHPAEPLPREHPDEIAYRHATALIASGAREEGLLALIQQAEQGSSWWETYNDLGAHAYGNGALEDAENLFQAAVGLEPTPSDASCNLARLRIAQNRREEALSLLGAVARTNPKRTDILIDIRSLLSSYDAIPPVVWARLLSDLRSTGNASDQP